MIFRGFSRNVCLPHLRVFRVFFTCFFTPQKTRSFLRLIIFDEKINEKHTISQLLRLFRPTLESNGLLSQARLLSADPKVRRETRSRHTSRLRAKFDEISRPALHGNGYCKRPPHLACAPPGLGLPAPADQKRRSTSQTRTLRGWPELIKTREKNTPNAPKPAKMSFFVIFCYCEEEGQA